MWRVTIRDLVFRRRQFLIAVLGAGVVFGLALLLSGVSQGFRTEVRDTIAAVGAERWIVPEGTPGPLGAETVVPEAAVAAVAAQPGARDVRPLVVFQAPVGLGGGGRETATLFGGTEPVPPGRAVVDERLGVARGAPIEIGGRRFTVERVVSGRTIFGGQPVIVLPFRDAQRFRFGRARSVSAVLADGSPRVPAGLVARSPAQVADGAAVTMEGATRTVDLFRIFMWLVAAIIVAAITYLTVQERLRDFAVLKAVGATSRALAWGVVLGAVLASLLATLVAAAIATLLAPVFPMPADIRPGAYLAMPVIAVVVGVLASLAALRRVQRIDPALAFGGAG
jgi:putative ABC transport system permease protein